MRATSAEQLTFSVNAFERRMGDLPAPSVTEDVLCEWLSWRIRETSRPTAKRDRGNILTLLRFAKSIGEINSVPEVETIKLERSSPRAWTMDQLAAIIRTARCLPGTMRHLPISRSWWFTSLYMFLYDGGSRVSSALSLRPPDLFIDRRIAMLSADTDKTWTEQVVYISDQTADILAENANGIARRAFVWPWPWHREKLWKDHKAICEAAGVPSGRKFAFHCFRRTHATQAVIAAGWSAAQRSLGHSSEAMTRVYVDTTQVQAASRITLNRPSL